MPNPGDEVYINATYSAVTFDWIYSDPLFGLEIDWYSTLSIPSNGDILMLGIPGQDGGLVIGKLGTGTLIQEGGTVIINRNTVVGSFGSGSFYQSGGDHTTHGDLNLAEHEGSSGLYDLTGGTLSIGNAERIGVSGVGYFYQYDGAHTVQSGFVLANNPGSVGYFYLGGGSLSTGESFIGMNGYGYFSQTGGIHTTGYDLNIAQEKQSYGIYNLYDGLLSVGRHLHVGLSGEGYFEQFEGTINVGSSLVLGNEKEGYGWFRMWDGTLTVGENAFVGMAGSGSMYQFGGSVKIGGGSENGSLILGVESESYGSYYIFDGSLLANFIQIGGTGTGEFFQDGGSVRVITYDPYNPSCPGGGINLGQVLGSEGRYAIWGGSLDTNDLLIGASGKGVFDHEGGTVTVYEGLVLAGDVVGTAYGGYDLKGGTLTSGNTQVGAWGEGVFFQTGGTHTTGFLGIGAAYDPRTGVKGKGVYSLVSGDLIVNGDTIVGWSGEGIFRQQVAPIL